MNPDYVYAARYHDFSCGHRVYGHEGKCANLHGHNYRVHFFIDSQRDATMPLDAVGRVIDFSIIKSTLCQWLEDNWDHRFLMWIEDPLSRFLREIDKTVVFVPFNPTAENMGLYLLNTVGPFALPRDVRLLTVKVEETRKCSVLVTRGQ